VLDDQVTALAADDMTELAVVARYDLVAIHHPVLSSRTPVAYPQRTAM
jgi:hypothetical protein